MIMLLHKLDSWHTANIVYTFSKFSNIEIFKPQKTHATRSSFYMIVKDIQPMCEAFRLALHDWSEDWYTATCGGENGTGEAIPEPSEEKVLVST